MLNKIKAFFPGLALLFNYKSEWFGKDLRAGFSVAVIALPIGLALAGLVGLPPEVGLYATIIPVTIFSIFSSSKQLIIGPDAPTCMMVAAVLLPFASAGNEAYYETCILLTILVGLLSVLGGIFRFGFISDFLSKPILIGYLNGLMFSIIISQIDKLFGFNIINSGFLRMLIDFFSKIGAANFTTVILGFSTVGFLLFMNKFLPKFPAAFIATVGSCVAVYYFDLQNLGVVTLGTFPAGMPPIGIPSFDLEIILTLLPGALGIVLISYCSAMLTGKSFAVKNHYEIDSNQEFIALGAANVASGLAGGFAASGADSLTAVAHSEGGKTSLTSIIASAALIAVLFFLAGPLTFIPFATLGAIVIVSVLELLNVSYLKRLYNIRKLEFYISILTTLCVISVGVMYAVLIAVGIAVFNLIRRASKPDEEELGRINDTDLFANIREYPDAKTIDGLLIYKFNSALVFFNTEHFKNKIRQLITKTVLPPQWLLIDASAINYIDTTATDMIADLVKELNSKGIKIAFASAQKGVMEIIEKSGLKEMIGSEFFFIHVSSGVKYFLESKNKI